MAWASLTVAIISEIITVPQTDFGFAFCIILVLSKMYHCFHNAAKLSTY